MNHLTPDSVDQLLHSGKVQVAERTGSVPVYRYSEGKLRVYFTILKDGDVVVLDVGTRNQQERDEELDRKIRSKIAKYYGLGSSDDDTALGIISRIDDGISAREGDSDLKATIEDVLDNIDATDAERDFIRRQIDDRDYGYCGECGRYRELSESRYSEDQLCEDCEAGRDYRFEKDD